MCAANACCVFSAILPIVQDIAEYETFYDDTIMEVASRNLVAAQDEVMGGSCCMACGLC